MEKNSTLDSPKDEPLITSLETEKEQKKIYMKIIIMNLFLIKFFLNGQNVLLKYQINHN